MLRAMLGTRIAKLYLRARGWHFETPLPSIKKFVVTAYPHTSNWDGIHLLMCATSAGLPLRWMVKRSLVDGPMGPFLTKLGAIPIDRSKAGNLVDQMVAEFDRRDELVLVIPPEGTRTFSEYWKSGFYHIALGANVPVVPGYLDFERKVGGVGEPIHLTGDVHADMDNLRAFYEELNPIGRYHYKTSPVRLRAEEEAAEATGEGS